MMGPTGGKAFGVRAWVFDSSITRDFGPFSHASE